MNFAPSGFETIRVYGVTRDPQNGEYAIVTEFKSGGNLREIIKKNHNNLIWNNILNIFWKISCGLDKIHEEKYYHKDLHSGNILNSIYDSKDIWSVISDFGLCRPMNQSSADKTPYGVLPFVAPEVLRGGEFTEAADIYGIGMLMSEVISGEPPFVDRDYDENLALAICYGQRPQIPEYTPEPYATLMKRCWDPVPNNRPTAEELRSQFLRFSVILGLSEDEFNKFYESSEFSEDESNEFSEDESSEFSEDESSELSEDESIELKDELSELKYSEVKEAFNQEREDKWKARLAELATNPIPLKKTQNLLTSKRLDYSHYLSQKLTVEDWNKLKLTD
jgi:serine/threonine protein kinase